MNITWLKQNNVLVTSLLIWDNDYLPHQVIVLRNDEPLENRIRLGSYFRNDTDVIPFNFLLSSFRTTSEEEVEFRLVMTIHEQLEYVHGLDASASSTGSSVASDEDPLAKLFNELFMSDLAMHLMLERHPTFGCYSMSPNLNKIQTILHNGCDPLFEELMRQKRK